MPDLPSQFADWFARKGWTIHPHQQEMLERQDLPALLLIAPTGGGKTLSGFLPSLVDLAHGDHEGMHTLYISPLKALAADIKRNLTTPVQDMGLPITIQERTGDTSATVRKRQRAAPPHILLTTPGDTFLIGGQIVKYEGLREMTVEVSRDAAKRPRIATFMGTKFATSTQLSDRVQRIFPQDSWPDLPVPMFLEAGRIPVKGAAEERLLAEEAARLMEASGLAQLTPPPPDKPM